MADNVLDSPLCCWIVASIMAELVPANVAIQIADHAVARPPRPTFQGRRRMRPLDTTGHPALVPPSNGQSPFMAISTELRKAIFAESLPAKDIVIQPKCDQHVADATEEASGKASKDKPKRNVASDLMTLNKIIRDEVAFVLYEERCFAIHVHEGIRDGGIEFLNTGRQPLQYKDEISDNRFARFSVGEDFGFDRLKKIRITIYALDYGSETSRHAVLNTYFMNLALCRLLERGGAEKNRITSLVIDFDPKNHNDVQLKGRRTIVRRENPWWDVDDQEPRQTSIHGLSNIELVLRPFATLSGCHAVEVYLPNQLTYHVKTVRFIQDLVDHMISTDPLAMGFVDDQFDQQIEAARAALEEHIMHTLYGVKDRIEVEGVTAEELNYGYACAEPDDGGKKHGSTPMLSDTGRKHREGVDSENIVNSDDEDEELQRVLLESAIATTGLQGSTGCSYDKDDSAIGGQQDRADPPERASTADALAPNTRSLSLRPSRGVPSSAASLAAGSDSTETPHQSGRSRVTTRWIMRDGQYIEETTPADASAETSSYVATPASVLPEGSQVPRCEGPRGIPEVDGDGPLTTETTAGREHTMVLRPKRKGRKFHAE